MNYFILLTQNSLVVYTKGYQPQLFSFPSKSVLHQEIVDNKLFESFLNSVLEQYPKQKIILFLSDELVYTSVIQLTDTVIIEEEVKKFIDTLPFTNESIVTIQVRTKTEIYLFAVNGEMYKTINALAQKKGCIIKEVLPRILFGQKLDPLQLSYESFTEAIKDKNLVEQGNFLQTTKKETKKYANTKQVALLFFCLILLGGAIYWMLSQ